MCKKNPQSSQSTTTMEPPCGPCPSLSDQKPHSSRTLCTGAGAGCPCPFGAPTLRHRREIDMGEGFKKGLSHATVLPWHPVIDSTIMPSTLSRLVNHHGDFYLIEKGGANNVHRAYVKIAPDVYRALSCGDPVVALESTIISHGKLM
ncbi:hypothetical protein Taro_000246 [Colocasia esculenta]|uniref:Uncharacterized protein n=1 Tax=Colocasia esculenta TaxID=4460 RepID=A0A843TBM8_COLES|nr:hypothetical protein [Colocasia esculenta]